MFSGTTVQRRRRFNGGFLELRFNGGGAWCSALGARCTLLFQQRCSVTIPSKNQEKDMNSANCSKGSRQKAAKFIPPGKLAMERGNLQKAARHSSESKYIASKSICETRIEEQTTQHMRSIRRIDGVLAHTLIMHYGEDMWEESDFTEEGSFLDILKICQNFIDIYSFGITITYGDGKKLTNDKDFLAMMREHEDAETIHIYLAMDENVQPVLFKMPEPNPRRAYIPRIPEVRDVIILGDYKINEKVVVHGDVINGSEEDCMVHFFISPSKNFENATDLQSISNNMFNKEFVIPAEAVGHFLIVKYTPMNEDGCGEPKYASTDKQIEDLIATVPLKPKRVRGKNKNKKIATLKPHEKIEIMFYNNRAVGENHSDWSRHLGKIVRDKNICPIRVNSWKEFTELNTRHMWDSVKECFTNPNIEFYRDHTLDHMRNLWTAWRSSLNRDYVKPCNTKAEVLKNVPSGMNDKDWEWLANNHFLTDDFKKISNLNSNNRGNRVNGVMPHRTGSKPHRQLIYEMRGKNNQPPDIAKIFLETRQRKGKFVEPEAQDKYDELAKTVQENAQLSQFDMVEKCFGPQRHSHVFGFGGGMKRKNFNDNKTDYIEKIESQLHEKEEENKKLIERMDEIECRLAQIENTNQSASKSPSTHVKDLEQVIQKTGGNMPN